MDSTIKPSPAKAPLRSKLAKTINKVIYWKRKATAKTHSNNGFCLLMPHEKLKSCDPKQQQFNQFVKDEFVFNESKSSKNKPILEAFVAKLFATVSSVKAAYAELQMAQFPYNGDAIQAADQEVVDELRALSELKHSLLKRNIDPAPPQLTIMLAEIQEQQALMKMYQITMNKMQGEIEKKDSQLASLRNELDLIMDENKSIEKKLNESGCFSYLDKIIFSNANTKDFIRVLHYAMRSVRNYVKLMVREMEAANWDIDEAANVVHPRVSYAKPNHRCYAFESFVCLEMLNGFDDPNFCLSNELVSDLNQRRTHFFEQFRSLKSANPVNYMRQCPDSAFGKFLKNKYFRLVHPKMETSFSGNLNQRKMVSNGEWPETEFFRAFAEMARRIWILHCLAWSFDQELSIFLVGKDSRFSEVYMESVMDDALTEVADGYFRVAFTVVPGFKLGKTVIQSKVYLSPVSNPTRR